jgi:hypothetical protein
LCEPCCQKNAHVKKHALLKMFNACTHLLATIAQAQHREHEAPTTHHLATFQSLQVSTTGSSPAASRSTTMTKTSTRTRCEPIRSSLSPCLYPRLCYCVFIRILLRLLYVRASSSYAAGVGHGGSRCLPQGGCLQQESVYDIVFPIPLR